MAVLAKDISVILKSTSIAQKFRGGTAAFVSACDHSHYCEDGKLTRVGFSSLHAAMEFVCYVADRGLSPYNAMTRRAEDLIVATEQRGFAIRCDWAEFRLLNGKGDPTVQIPVCRATGDDSLQLAAPDGWRSNFPSSLDLPVAAHSLVAVAIAV